tara:strand:- start:74 stop:748 length:675 start_codon:yes stop_codon:yes gene_type:complete
MAISFSSFITQVRNYTEVGSNVLTDSQISEFIRNTELDVAGKVDYDELRKYATSTFNTSNRAVSLPADCMIVRSVQSLITANGTTTRTFLEERDTSFISEYNNNAAEGSPIYFANYDSFNIIVAPEPAGAYTVQLNYIKDPPHFTSTNQTFLAKYQESMLLHGVLAEAFRFLKGPDNLYNLYKTKYDEEIQNFALQQMGRRRRGEFDDGVPRIKVPSPTPNTTY